MNEARRHNLDLGLQVGSRSGPELCGLVDPRVDVHGLGCLTEGVSGLAAALFFFPLSYLCTLAGRRCLGVVPSLRGGSADFPTTFLLGFFFLNTALLFAALATPLGLPVNALGVALGVVGWCLAAGPAPPGPRARFADAMPGLGCTLISLLAATFWSADSIDPMIVSRGAVVFRPWSDSFLHACLVRMLRDALPPARFSP